MRNALRDLFERQVRHAGNVADPATGSPYGAVAYAYKTGKYEVTNAQYTAFLNAADPCGEREDGKTQDARKEITAAGGREFFRKNRTLAQSGKQGILGI